MIDLIPIKAYLRTKLINHNVLFQMKLVIALLIVGALASQAAPPPMISSHQEELPVAPKVDYILKRDFLPSEYTIYLKTYLADIYDEKDRFVFNGTSEMIFQYYGNVSENVLTIHVKNLNGIKYELFELNNGTKIEKKIDATDSDKITDKVNITLSGETFKNGVNYSLTSTYIGQMDDDMHGFYRSQYEDDKGNKKYDRLNY